MSLKSPVNHTLLPRNSEECRSLTPVRGSHVCAALKGVVLTRAAVETFGLSVHNDKSRENAELQWRVEYACMVNLGQFD